tara:strand:+ start:106 stop:441 length:336 start_codon:yes stop_codon:yes gene_type:complete
MDGRIDDPNMVYYGEKYIRGEKDLIRKIVARNIPPLDFFFCDTGEYSGHPEWNIVKDLICPDGIFAAHDINYPKSIKSFRAVEEIENSDKWEVLDKTISRCGMIIAKKLTY